jgi:hypothetical protein
MAQKTKIIRKWPALSLPENGQIKRGTGIYHH